MSIVKKYCDNDQEVTYNDIIKQILFLIFKVVGTIKRDTVNNINKKISKSYQYYIPMRLS